MCRVDASDIGIDKADIFQTIEITSIKGSQFLLAIFLFRTSLHNFRTCGRDRFREKRVKVHQRLADAKR